MNRFFASMICASGLAVAALPLSAQQQGARIATPDAQHSRVPHLVTGAVAEVRGIPPDSLTTSFLVDGITVILRRNTANNVVAANLYLLGGTRQITRATSGIEPFLLHLSERGTQSYPKTTMRKTMSLLGSQIVVAPSSDWTLFGVRTITQVFDSTWAVFADRVMHPAFDADELELLRAQFLSAVRQQRDDPDELVSVLADSIAFEGHPYAIPVIGTLESLQSFTISDLKRYHATQFVKSRMLLVVVGNVERDHIESLVKSTLAKLPQGDYVWTLPPALPVTPARAVIVQRDLPTNYILGYFAGPPASSPDYQALRVATTVLSGRMFGEIRSRRNLTYDVHAPFLDRGATAGGLYVSTVSPDSTLRLMKYFVQEIQNEILTPLGLKRLELEYLTDYFLDNETNASQADFLARAQLYQGSYRRGAEFVNDLRNVTPEIVRRVARRYMHDMKFAYVGDPERVTKAWLEAF